MGSNMVCVNHAGNYFTNVFLHVAKRTNENKMFSYHF